MTSQSLRNNPFNSLEDSSVSYFVPEDYSSEQVEAPIKLTPTRVFFEPSLQRVFFDFQNFQLFTVQPVGSGQSSVSVKNTTVDQDYYFKLHATADIISLKFSSDSSVLGIQSTVKSVEFNNFSNGELDPVSYTQQTRTRGARLLTFIWLSADEVLFVTDHSLELYRVLAARRKLNFVRSSLLVVTRVLWTSDSIEPLARLNLPASLDGALVVRCSEQALSSAAPSPPTTDGATSSTAVPLSPFVLSDFDETQSLLVLYHKLYLPIVRTTAPASSAGASASSTTSYTVLILHEIDQEPGARQTHVFCLPPVPCAPASASASLRSSRVQSTPELDAKRVSPHVRSQTVFAGALFAPRPLSAPLLRISSVDNLLIIHSALHNKTFMFDAVVAAGGELDEYCLRYHSPILPPLRFRDSLAPSSPPQPSSPHCDNPSAVPAPASSSSPYDNWVTFGGAGVIDKQHGKIWNLEVALDACLELLPDNLRRVEFLVHRSKNRSPADAHQLCIMNATDPRALLMQLLQRICLVEQFTELERIRRPFDAIAQFYAKELMFLQQKELFELVFGPHLVVLPITDNPETAQLIDNEELRRHRMAIMCAVEFLAALNRYRVPVEEQLALRLLYHLIASLPQQLPLLQLLLQYHCVPDSLPIARFLLENRVKFPPGYHLALDMLKRIGADRREILNAMMSAGEHFEAATFAIREAGALLADERCAIPLLQAASNSNRTLFYSLYNAVIRLASKTPWFHESADFLELSKKYHELFPSKEMR